MEKEYLQNLNEKIKSGGRGRTIRETFLTNPGHVHESKLTSGIKSRIKTALAYDEPSDDCGSSGRQAGDGTDS